jgi:hypothetical protein
MFENLDTKKLAEATLGLLALTLHDGCRAWKGIDWDVMDLLYQRGWILDPRGKNPSVVLTESGLEIAEAMLMRHFGQAKTADTAVPFTPETLL